MVIIMRFINSLARTSFTRTSSLSARSFTVMPSASVMVRVIGGGAAGAEGIDGADGRSRRVCVGALTRGPMLSERAAAVRRRSGAARGGRWPCPGAPALAAACAPAATAADADRRACPESSDAAASTAPEALARRRRVEPAPECVRAAGVAGLAPAGGRRRRLHDARLRHLRTLGRRKRPRGLRRPARLLDAKPKRRWNEASRRCRWRRNRRGCSDRRGRLFDWLLDNRRFFDGAARERSRLEVLHR